MLVKLCGRPGKQEGGRDSLGKQAMGAVDDAMAWTSWSGMA